MIGHGVQRIRKRVLDYNTASLRCAKTPVRSFCDLCDAIDIDTMIQVVTWYKQEVNRVFEQEVNLVLVDVLPVSC